MNNLEKEWKIIHSDIEEFENILSSPVFSPAYFALPTLLMNGFLSRLF